MLSNYLLFPSSIPSPLIMAEIRSQDAVQNILNKLKLEKFTEKILKTCLLPPFSSKIQPS